ncbi:hypothetical protein NDU88_001243 [Pleurodeles waltl]|uniref:Uncharacterized protein n=1 Tax=Pleurodeles waltl TaxID=8319 RepID=A0AAV7P4U9_PLEWA|nr:hypothetical protein NDU88_001243 [Pleurodeles waltl]
MFLASPRDRSTSRSARAPHAKKKGVRPPHHWSAGEALKQNPPQSETHSPLTRACMIAQQHVPTAAPRHTQPPLRKL